MKKWLVFTLGVLTGILLVVGSVIIFVAVSSSEAGSYDRADHAVPFTAATRFKVIKVTPYGAFARCDAGKYPDTDFTGPEVLIETEDENANLFYDGQIIEVPSGQWILQIGTYRHSDDDVGEEKVIPVIKFKQITTACSFRF